MNITNYMQFGNVLYQQKMSCIVYGLRVKMVRESYNDDGEGGIIIGRLLFEKMAVCP